VFFVIYHLTLSVSLWMLVIASFGLFKFKVGSGKQIKNMRRCHD